LRVRLPARPVRPVQSRPDGLRRLDGGLAGRPVVDVRPAQQRAQGRTGADWARAGCAGRGDGHHLRAGGVPLDEGVGGRGGGCVMVDPASVDWSTARRAAYRLRQTFRYEYAAPIADLNHRLVVIPPMRFGDQRRTYHELLVELEEVRLQNREDRFGNVVFE